jgi:hypothetical protein
MMWMMLMTTQVIVKMKKEVPKELNSDLGPY